MHNNIYKWYADEEEAKLWRPLLDKIIFEKETTNMSTNTTNPFYAMEGMRRYYEKKEAVGNENKTVSDRP